MMIDFREANLELQREQVLSFRDVAGLQMRCKRGSLWLTEEGGREVVLKPGDCFTVERGGITLVSGMKDGSSLSVKASTQPPVLHDEPWMTRLIHALGFASLRKHPAGELHGC